MVLPLFVLAFLIACLIAYWRTLWVGKKYRVPVAACALLNMVSIVAMSLLGVEVWERRTYLLFGLLALAAGMFLLAAVWEKRLKQQQEDSLEKPKEL